MNKEINNSRLSSMYGQREDFYTHLKMTMELLPQTVALGERFLELRECSDTKTLNKLGVDTFRFIQRIDVPTVHLKVLKETLSNIMTMEIGRIVLEEEIQMQGIKH